MSDKEGSREFRETIRSSESAESSEEPWVFWWALAPWRYPVWGRSLLPVPSIASLAGLSVGGAVGGLVGALVGLGIPEYEAKLYDGRVKDGGVLLVSPLRSAMRRYQEQETSS